MQLGKDTAEKLKKKNTAELQTIKCRQKQDSYIDKAAAKAPLLRLEIE
jgi:hypothetical protein